MTTQTPTQDTILVNVNGTNKETREQKAVFGRFNGEGAPIDNTGNVISGTALKFLGDVSDAPAFPIAEYTAAVKSGDLEGMAAITSAHQDLVEAWTENQGGSKELQIANAVLEYCVTEHGFLRDDGNGFVLKLDNLDVQRNELKDGRKMYTVSGTAVFGSEA